MADIKQQSRKEVLHDVNKTLSHLSSMLRDYNNRVIGTHDKISYHYETMDTEDQYSYFKITSKRKDDV